MTQIKKGLVNVFLFLCFLAIGYARAEVLTPLSLAEAEQAAIHFDPELKSIQAATKTLEHRAVSVGQLADPKLVTGIANLPTNNFSFTQDEMTMINIGLEQSFPHGRSLKIKSRQMHALATAEQRKLQEQTLSLIRQVRETWVDLYYWNETLSLMQKNRSLLKLLLKTTESQYRVGKANQSDILQVQIELSQNADQIIQIQQQIDISKAQLGRLIGTDQAARPLELAFPRWQAPLH